MVRPSKRTITVSILSLAGLAVVVALMLTGRDPSAVAAKPDPNFSPPPAKITEIPIKPQQNPPEEVPTVDVVFVLDTTGSMSGLIEGAKQKIWSIANQILSGQPRPEVRVGLVGYRDQGDAYVTRTFPLSDTMEEVYDNLKSFSADGGGDTPEHVNRALADAIHKMQWREGDKTLKLIFLVGDAPPHEGRDGLRSSRLAAEARSKGIAINTIRCGTYGPTELAWKRIAQEADGMYASIRQDGAMVAVATPHDDRLKELNEALTRTLLPTGDTAEKERARRRMSINASMGSMAQAESAKMRARTKRLDKTDLLFQLKGGKKLEDLPEEALPEPVAKAPKAHRKAVVADIKRKRSKILSEIEELSRERDAYLKANRPADKPTGFDDTIGKALKSQGGRAGIAY